MVEKQQRAYFKVTGKEKPVMEILSESRAKNFAPLFRGTVPLMGHSLASAILGLHLSLYPILGLGFRVWGCGFRSGLYSSVYTWSVSLSHVSVPPCVSLSPSVPLCVCPLSLFHHPRRNSYTPLDCALSASNHRNPNSQPRTCFPCLISFHVAFVACGFPSSGLVGQPRLQKYIQVRFKP